MDYEKEARKVFAKLHPEMFGWAKYHYANFSEEDKQFWESIFPELAESEDERTRKELRDILVNCCEADRKFPHLLAWLEKQKKHKPNIELIQRSWYMEGYHDATFKREPRWLIVTGEGGTRYEPNPNYGETLKDEQKPVEKQDYSGLTDFERAIHRGFLCAGVANVPVTIIKETANDCLSQIEEPTYGEYLQYGERQYARGFKDGSETKPAEWSEEDEKDIAHIIRILDDCYAYGKHDLSKTDQMPMDL